ncbi:unnamed protein product [Urochloa humidicola]
MGPCWLHSGGEFVVAVTWNHAAADGAGMAQFVQAVGELARGSPSVPPVRLDDSLPATLPAVVPVARKLLSLDPLDDLACLDFTVPASVIRRVRAEFAGDPPCTAFEAATAVVWRCRTRAAMSDSGSDPEAPVALLFSANARRLVGAKEGYYGNCMTAATVVAERSSAVASGDVVELVKMIRDAKERIPDQLKLKRDEGGGDLPELRDRYDMVVVSSWRNLGFDEVDFGGGTPARVTSRMRERPQFPGFGVLPPCKGRDGVNVLSVAVKEKHADAFLGELARLV